MKYGMLYIVLATTFIYCLIGSVELIAADGRWYWQNPTPQGNDLLDVHVINDYTAVAVGRTGMILKTMDGGVTWEHRESHTRAWLNSAFFVDEAYGWVVGGESRLTKDGRISTHIILHTSDGGETWVVQSEDESGRLNSVYFADRNNGWAVGEHGTILRTTDGGRTWLEQESGTSNSIYSVHFIDSSTGWVVGGRIIVRIGLLTEEETYMDEEPNVQTILYTNDGGENWIEQAGPDKWQHVLFSVIFVNDNTGWAVGSGGAILKTIDAGKNWKRQKSDTRRMLYSVHFLDEHTGWAVGSNGTKILTTNGGITWNNRITEFSHNLRSVHFADPNTGWIVGERGAIFGSHNGGRVWYDRLTDKLNLPRGRDRLYSVYFLDSNTGWVVSEVGTIIHTSDGGQTWTRQKDESYPLLAVYFLNAKTGWATGWRSVYHTVDGGNTWNEISYSGYRIFTSIYFVDEKIGWAAGFNAAIYRTNDGGRTWSTHTTGAPSFMNTIHFIDSNIGWAAGNAGAVAHTRDGGRTWELQETNVSSSLQDIHFIDASTGWVVGYQGTVLHTVDGGNTWKKQETGIRNIFKSVHFTDNNTGWIVGSQGIILYTGDGGKTWEKEWSGTSQNLYSVYFTDKREGWAVGIGGTILHYTSETPPDDWKTPGPIVNGESILYDNYPNPFNTSTNIRFNLTEDSYVELAVYDVSGRKVARLAEGFLISGEYRYIFDASHLSSGMYIYRFRAGNFFQSRRMLVLK